MLTLSLTPLVILKDLDYQVILEDISTVNYSDPIFISLVTS